MVIISSIMCMLFRDMTENDVAVISSNGQLTLTSVSRDHEGEWRCQATNSSGSTEARTRLIVAPGKGMYILVPCNIGNILYIMT